jgi:hypothetical protein
MNVEHFLELQLAGETEVLGEFPSQYKFFQPQILHDLTWVRTMAAAVGSRRLIA